MYGYHRTLADMFKMQCLLFTMQCLLFTMQCLLRVFCSADKALFVVHNAMSVMCFIGVFTMHCLLRV